MNTTFREHPKLTRQQQDWICEVIGDWYLIWKTRIAPKEHSLGFAKEQLKEMLCEPERYYKFLNDCDHESKPQE